MEGCPYGMMKMSCDGGREDRAPTVGWSILLGGTKVFFHE
jgi:hypothetical protein